MNTTNAPWSQTVEILTSIQIMFTYIISVLLFIGIFPNIIIFIIFFQNKFRKNTCSILCAAVSIVNNLLIAQGLVHAILSIIYGTDAENKNLGYCKTRLYLRHSMMMSNRTYTTLACAAAFALSSEKANIRSLVNRVSSTYLSIIITWLFWFLISMFIPFHTTLEENLCSMSATYEIIFSIYLFIAAGIISPILMIVFSFLTLSNLKRLHQRLYHRDNNHNTSFRLRKKDTQLIRMLLFHVLAYILATFLYPINMLYLSITQNYLNKSVERIAIESLITFFIQNFIFYFNNITPFFIYYFASSTFRSELKTICYKWRNRRRVGNG